jgi:DNA-binding Lrp family transcriptional regulator
MLAALLEPPREIVEEAQRIGRYSGIEGEILVLLQRPARNPPSFREIRSELAPFFSEPEVWKGILDLLDDGLIRATYTSGFEIGIEWA